MTANRKKLDSGVEERQRRREAAAVAADGGGGDTMMALIDGGRRRCRQQQRKERGGWVGRGCCVFVCGRKVIGSCCSAEGAMSTFLLA